MLSIKLETLSKKYIWLLLLVTVGAELALFGSRHSYFFADLYNFIMIASIFVAARLHPVLQDQSKLKRTKKQTFYLFVKVFVIFTSVTFIIDLLSNSYLQDFHEDYVEGVTEYTENYSYSSDWNGDFSDGAEGESGFSFLSWLDSDGYSFFTDMLAGFEEVSRLAYILLVVAFMKMLYPSRWEEGRSWFFWLFGLFISSFMFGIGHTLSSEQTFDVFLGTVVYYTNFGLVLGILLLWTRNLWLLILVHALHNVLTSISWYYVEGAHVIFYFIMLITLITMFFMEKYLFTTDDQTITLKEDEQTYVSDTGA
ncbi:CPBP family intramembrane metalloprotease [Bacillus sp. BGMRC 2118]|nr:CPBP family intramembrane metalloprotease [Bacillus sp. BGMRC 2118]